MEARTPCSRKAGNLTILTSTPELWKPGTQILWSLERLELEPAGEHKTAPSYVDELALQPLS